MLRGLLAPLLAAALCAGQSPGSGIDARLAARIKQEVAGPITRALPGWLVGDDLGPAAVEAWDSKDARRLRATLMYVPVARSAGATIEQAVGSVKTIPGWTLLQDDPACRSVLADDFAEAVSLVKRPDDSYTFYLHRAVALSDAFMPPLLLATFRSRKGQSLEDFKASVAARIRGLDPVFDTFLMLALGRRVHWDGDGRVTISHADKAWTFVAPEGFERVADDTSIARWKSAKATARVHAVLGAEQDAVAFARRWLEEPCVEGDRKNTPLMVVSAPEQGEYTFFQLPQKDTKGCVHRAQIRGGPTVFFVYDVAIDVLVDEPKEAALAGEAAVKAAFAATKEAPVEKPAAPIRKG